VTAASFEPYLHDASGYHGEASQVFLPAEVNELREIVRASAAQRTPITIAGAGTGLTGARVPHGGCVISLERFRKLEVESGRAHCGPGLLLQDLQAEAAKSKQFFGPNPTESSASLGGIFSTNAGGSRSFHYGQVRRNVLAVEVMFANGETRRFEQHEAVDFPYDTVHTPATTKNSAGYPLTPDLKWVDLMAGSEGTLGIVTEIDVRLLAKPAAILSGVVFFPSDEKALNAVDAWRPLRELRLIEFMDEHSLRLLKSRYGDIPSEASAALLVEQNLSSEQDAEVDDWVERLEQEEALQEASWFGFSQADQDRFREFRHTLAVIVTDTARRNGFPKFSTDFAVPLDRHRELHEHYKRRCAEVLPGQFTIFGHVGDANNHINLLPQTPKQAQDGVELIHEFAEHVVSLDGTVAAEHGIGKIKTDLLKLMYSPKEVEAMRNVKTVLDPAWLLGQGTLFDKPCSKA
jgi:FAD/FMN-containing dehydrogenase